MARKTNKTNTNGKDKANKPAVEPPKPFDPTTTPIKPTHVAELGQIYVFMNVEGVKKFIWHAKTKAKLTTFSVVARHQLATNKDANGQSIREVFYEDEADEVSVRRVLHWIETNDLNKPRQLTLALLPADHKLIDAMKLHHAAYSLRVPKEYRAEDVHTRCFESICPPVNFTVQMFKDVHQFCFFDRAVWTQMKKKAGMFKWKGWMTEDDVNHMLDYLEGAGIFDEVSDVQLELIKEKESGKKKEKAKDAAGAWSSQGAKERREQGKVDVFSGTATDKQKTSMEDSYAKMTSKL